MDARSAVRSDGDAGGPRPALRIHFTAEDLANVRVAAEPDPMWETMLSVHLLRTRRGGQILDDWRRGISRQLDATGRLLLPLNPPIGDFPDFLTPACGVTELGEGIELMRATPKVRVRAELGTLSIGQSQLPWVGSLADGGVAAMERLGHAVRSYYRIVVAPHWTAIRASIAAERSRVGHTLLDGGWPAVAGAIGPGAHWRSSTLEVPYPVDRDLWLDGRGLLLIPSWYCWRMPVTLVDPQLSPVLVYPIHHDPKSLLADFVAGGGDRELTALIGHTRAAILRALETAGSTKELVRRVGVSPASASQHATVLRNAGLVSTRRDGGSMLHSLTPLGKALLAGTAWH